MQAHWGRGREAGRHLRGAGEVASSVCVWLQELQWHWRGMQPKELITDIQTRVVITFSIQKMTYLLVFVLHK